MTKELIKHIRYLLCISFLYFLSSFYLLGQTYTGLDFIEDSLGYTINPTLQDFSQSSYEYYKKRFDQVEEEQADSSMYYLTRALATAIELNSEEGIRYASYQLSRVYIMTGEYDQAYLVSNFCINQVDTLDVDYYRCLRLKGTMEIAYQNYETAIHLFEKSITYATYAKDTTSLIDTYQIMGDAFRYSNTYDKAMESLLKGLELAKSRNDSSKIARLYNALGTVQFNFNEIEEALTYFEKATQLATNKEPWLILDIALSKLLAYYHKQAYGKALAESKRLTQLIEKSGFEAFRFINEKYAAKLYMKFDDYTNAVPHIEKCSQLLADRQDFDKLDLYVLQSQLYYYQKKYKNAKNAISKASQYLTIKFNYGTKADYFEMLIKINTALGIWDSSEEDFNNFEKYKDSVYYERKELAAKKIATEYQVKSIQDSIALLGYQNQLLEEQQVLKNVTIQQRTILSGVALVFLAFTGFLAFLQYRSNQQKKQYNLQLEKEMHLLNENLKNTEIIQQQTKQLQVAEQQKNKLFTNIAHEFQTPLNIIQGLGRSLYQSQSLPQNEQNNLGLIIKNSQYLSEATSQILSLHRNKTKEVVNSNKWFYFNELLAYIQPEYELLAATKNIKMDIASDVNSPISMYLDVQKVQTIFKNLLSNALRYTQQEGTIQMKHAYDPTTKLHQVQVKDTGKGIPQQEIATIFDRYVQSESAATVGGFGLGLAICKEYVADLNGTIEVESEVGIGSTFTISFPNAPTESAAATAVYHQFNRQIIIPEQKLVPLATPPKNAKIHLLVVEDNLDYCQYLQTILEKAYHLAFAQDGIQAIQYLKNHQPTLILTDWMMPNMDGPSFVKYLKESEEFSHYPILMLTAKDLSSNRVSALRVGVDDYLIKPIDADRLKNSINRLLNAQEEKKVVVDTLPKEENVSDTSLSRVEQQWLEQLEDTMYPHIGNFDLNVDFIADLFYMTPQRLNRKIKKLTGFTTKKYIQELRYWEARKLLEVGEVESVKEVCSMVGFKDVKHFSRKYKERFGISPSELL